MSKKIKETLKAVEIEFYIKVPSNKEEDSDNILYEIEDVLVKKFKVTNYQANISSIVRARTKKINK